MSDSLSKLALSPEERRRRREEYNRLAAEDIAAIDQLTVEYLSLQTGNALTATRIKSALFRMAEAFNMIGEVLPGGYRVLGTGEKTPYYLQMSDNTKPSDAQLVSDAMSGLLLEVAEIQQQRIERWKKQHAKPEGAP